MTRSPRFIALCLAVALALCVAMAPARAQLLFTLDPWHDGPAGSSVVFNGTITNTSGSDVFVNGLGVAFNAPGGLYLSSDSLFFGNNVPGVLAMGDTYTGPVMKIDISPTALPTNFLGTATLQGDASGKDNMLMNPISPPANFRVTVTPAPGGLASVSVIALCGVGLAWRRRRGV